MTPGHPVARLREAPSASSARALSLACGSWGLLSELSLLPNPGEATHNAPLGATPTTSAPPLPQLQCPCQLCTPSSSACAQLNARQQHPQNAGRCPNPGTSPGLVPSPWLWGRQPARIRALCSGSRSFSYLREVFMLPRLWDGRRDEAMPPGFAQTLPR